MSMWTKIHILVQQEIKRKYFETGEAEQDFFHFVENWYLYQKIAKIQGSLVPLQPILSNNLMKLLKGWLKSAQVLRVDRVPT